MAYSHPRDSFPQGPVLGRPWWEPARVQCYSGYTGEETPRAVVLCGIVFPVAEVLSRRRVCDLVTGAVVEIFECRLEAGWPVSLERSADGSWRIRRTSYVSRIDLN